MMKCFVYILLISVSIVNLSAQESGKINVSVNNISLSRYPLVDVFVNFTDEKGEPVDNSVVSQSIEELRHNRKIVNVEKLSSVYNLKQSGDAELYLALILDNSNSMFGRTELLDQAAETFIDGLMAGVYVTIIDYGVGDPNHSVEIPEFNKPLKVRERIGFSNSKHFLRTKVKTTALIDYTYMNDAILYGLSSLNDADVLGIKSIVLFTDGEDVGSESEYELIKRYTELYDIPIYALDLNVRENRTLKKLANESGGIYYYVKSPNDLIPLFNDILDILKSQYRLTYQSPESIVNQNTYTIDLELKNDYGGSDSRTFIINEDKIAYYNLVYTESTGNEKEKDYLDFMVNYPQSKHFNDIELRLGNFWFSRGEFANALSIYNKILRNPQRPAYFEALAQKAELLSFAKNYAESREAYEKIIAGKSSSTLRPKALFDLANTYSAEGNYISALETYSSLVSNYEGTEWAGEGLLQSSMINLEMGNLNQAVSGLNTVVMDYADSKSAAFAKFELAKIEEQNQNYDKAIELFQSVIDSKVDPGLIEQSGLKLGAILMVIGKYPAAINVFGNVIANTTSPNVAVDTKEKLITAYIKNNQIASARSTFTELPVEKKNDLISSNRDVEFNMNGTTATALMNGSFIAPVSSAAAITTVQMPELASKFAVLGPIYSVQLGSAPSLNVSIPVDPQWMDEKLIVPGQSGVYLYENNDLKLIAGTDENFSDSYDFTAANSGLYVLLAEKPKVIKLFNIYFDLGKASIRKDAEKNLFKMVDYLKSYPRIEMEIAGHTDSTGTDELNFELSLSRAESIKNFLVLNGVESDRLTVRGYGSQYPLEKNTTDENRQKNRRTEFIVISGFEDVTGTEAQPKDRFAVSIQSFQNVKTAYDQKKFFQQRGFDVSVLTNDSKTSNKYELILGIYDDKEKAETAIGKFNEVFKQYSLQINKL
ncbi:MAG: tetratricopeptide repeat protein [Melioribacteraceae bacterium]|nr:tetratricopeptide repeat protein [Melioribacteraceae bacterium]MCF8356152.1 tetratricopeptide repeat protein [Melioribacteraceae bacterium]MCF8395618.1 tetratricopeptide repeat protein [Melioribacteraceae bacterium]MCF8420869.1 tetratricopeptide repeat protein [Melioribacteraceae bacterium]